MAVLRFDGRIQAIQILKPRLAWSMSKNFLLVPVALEVLRDGMRWVFILFVYVFGGCLAMSGREFLGIGLQT
jgi:hypothetical protein